MMGRTFDLAYFIHMLSWVNYSNNWMKPEVLHFKFVSDFQEFTYQ